MLQLNGNFEIQFVRKVELWKFMRDLALDSYRLEYRQIDKLINREIDRQIIQIFRQIDGYKDILKYIKVDVNVDRQIIIQIYWYKGLTGRQVDMQIYRYVDIQIGKYIDR